MRRGDLVPDELVIEILWQPIVTAAASGGYVLDGFPRTLAQAEASYAMAAEARVTAHAAVFLEGDPDRLVGRMLARAATQGRTDDVETVIRHRLEVFDAETRPVIAHYDSRGLLVRVDAMAAVDEVTAAVLAAVEPLRPIAD
jgi:adenylate kinase